MIPARTVGIVLISACASSLWAAQEVRWERTDTDRIKIVYEGGVEVSRLRYPLRKLNWKSSQGVLLQRRLEMGEDLAGEGRLSSAESLLENVLDTAQRAKESEANMAEILIVLADVYRRRDSGALAETMLRRVLKIRGRLRGKFDQSLLEPLHLLTRLYLDTKRQSAARPVLEWIQEIRSRNKPSSPPRAVPKQVLARHSNEEIKGMRPVPYEPDPSRGGALSSGDRERAMMRAEVQGRARREPELVLPPPRTGTSRLPEAPRSPPPVALPPKKTVPRPTPRPTARPAVRPRKRVPLRPRARDLPNNPAELQRLAEGWIETRELEAAEQALSKLVKLERARLGAENPELSASLIGLAKVHELSGEARKALPLYQQALELWKQAMGADHPQLSSLHGGLANVYLDLENYTEAESHFWRTLELRGNLLGRRHPEVARVMASLAFTQLRRGDVDQASSMVKTARTIMEEIAPPEHPSQIWPLTVEGAVRAQQGDLRSARVAYHRALQLSQKNRSVDPELLRGFVAVLNKLGESKAAHFLERALASSAE